QPRHPSPCRIISLAERFNRQRCRQYFAALLGSECLRVTELVRCVLEWVACKMLLAHAPPEDSVHCLSGGVLYRLCGARSLVLTCASKRVGRDALAQPRRCFFGLD